MKLTYKNYSEIYELPELQNLQYEMLFIIIHQATSSGLSKFYKNWISFVTN